MLSGSSDSVSTEELLCSDSTPIQDVPDSSNSPKLMSLISLEVVAKLEEGGNRGEVCKIESEVVRIKTEKHTKKKRKRDSTVIARNDNIIDQVDGDDKEDAIDLTLDYDDFSYNHRSHILCLY